jgi:hypothetical protein
MISVRTERHDAVFISGSGHPEREVQGQDFDVSVTAPGGEVRVALFYGNAVWNVQVGRAAAWPVNVKPFGPNGVLISILSPEGADVRVDPHVN